MNPKLSDDAVADLPLHHGRAELLEEIMRTPVIDDRPTVTSPSRRRRAAWLAPVAAAASVVALVGATAWWAGTGPEPARDGGAGVAAAPASRAQVVLDAPGWTVDYADVDDSFVEVSYVKGDQVFDVTRYPAGTYDEYVEDRRHITEPPTDGEPIEVLGKDAQLWAYSGDDHASIREVEGDTWFEFRGTGMSETAYLDLLGQLRQVDQAEFEASLPDSVLTPSGGPTPATPSEAAESPSPQ